MNVDQKILQALAENSSTKYLSNRKIGKLKKSINKKIYEIFSSLAYLY